jgi:hypothetical protein
MLRLAVDCARPSSTECRDEIPSTHVSAIFVCFLILQLKPLGEHAEAASPPPNAEQQEEAVALFPDELQRVIRLVRGRLFRRIGSLSIRESRRSFPRRAAAP